MKESEGKNFITHAEIVGITNRPLRINYKETTDGIPYYECIIDDQKIQLRKDEKWELIWGDLKPETVEQLGKVIDNESNL
ncbi:MAG TPA: hypothetical protein VKB19_00140 [Pedobacter sp.]|nr:hypothetical protein [Pedobacter sp.]